MASSYDGYVGLDKKGRVVTGHPTREDQARGSKRTYEQNYESQKTDYETYHKKTDPSPSSMPKRLESADEVAGRALDRTGRDADNEVMRERRRGGRNAGEAGKPWNEHFKD